MYNCANSRIHEKEFEKIKKYQDLKWEIRKMWGIKNVDVVPVVVGALDVDCRFPYSPIHFSFLKQFHATSPIVNMSRVETCTVYA